MASVIAARKHRLSLDDTLLEAIGIQKIKVKGKSEEEAEAKCNGKFGDRMVAGQDIRYFIPDKDFFSPMGKSKKGDWLAEHNETGQTYKQFITGGYRGPDRVRHTIYLAPICFKEDPIPMEVLEPLKNFAALFFGMKVKCMKEQNLVGKVTDRINDGIYQTHAGKILNRLEEKVPKDAFCVAGITMCDIYPKEAWNFVFGLARSPGRTGVYSLARYLLNFGENSYTQIDLDSDPLPTILVRACKTMCHEMGHMFGLRHCTHFKCLMNGSNHLKESDCRPNFLCPICLRKLHHVCRFDIIQRYKDMRDFWSEQGLMVETTWLERRLNKLLAGHV